MDMAVSRVDSVQGLDTFGTACWTVCRTVWTLGVKSEAESQSRKSWTRSKGTEMEAKAETKAWTESQRHEKDKGRD